MNRCAECDRVAVTETRLLSGERLGFCVHHDPNEPFSDTYRYPDNTWGTRASADDGEMYSPTGEPR